MRDIVDDIRAHGADLAAIGGGTPDQAAQFRAEQTLPFELYADPDMAAYRAAGLRRGVARSLSLRAARHAVRAWRNGHRQGRTQGDPWQQGGAFVIAPGDRVVYEYIAQVPGDHPEPAALVAAAADAGRIARRAG